MVLPHGACFSLSTWIVVSRGRRACKIASKISHKVPYRSSIVGSRFFFTLCLSWPGGPSRVEIQFRHLVRRDVPDISCEFPRNRGDRSIGVLAAIYESFVSVT